MRFLHNNKGIGIDGNYFLFMAAGIAGSLTVILLSALCEQTSKAISRPLAWAGKHSLFIFASHQIVFNLLNQCYGLLGISIDAALPGEIFYSILTVVICCLCCAVVFPFAPVLEGK